MPPFLNLEADMLRIAGTREQLQQAMAGHLEQHREAVRAKAMSDLVAYPASLLLLLLLIPSFAFPWLWLVNLVLAAVIWRSLRTQQEMDQLVAAAGFEKVAQETDPWGIFTVSLARRRPQEKVTLAKLAPVSQARRMEAAHG